MARRPVTDREDDTAALPTDGSAGWPNVARRGEGHRRAACGRRGARRVHGRIDTAVVASADTDLVPALEEALRAGKRVETASWSGPATGFTALRVSGYRTLEPSPQPRALRSSSGHHRLPGQVIESGRGAGGRVGAAGPRWDRLHLGGGRAPRPQAGPARPGVLRRRPPPRTRLPPSCGTTSQPEPASGPTPDVGAPWVHLAVTHQPGRQRARESREGYATILQS